MPIEPRVELASLPEAVHGGIDTAECERLGIDPRTVIDFGTNVNPFGPSPCAMAAISETPLDGYPDRECSELRSELSARLNVPRERLLVGNGSSELLQLVALAYFRPG